MKKMLEKITKKIDDDSGIFYVPAIIIIIILIVILMVFMEYKRIHYTIETVKNAYEKAIISTAISNYDEIFTGTREHTMTGGYFDGGNEGEDNDYELPYYISENDYGEIEDEIKALLGLRTVEKNLVKYVKDEIQYIIDDFRIDVRESIQDYENYKIEGVVHLEIPMYFLGNKVATMDFDINCVTKWKTRRS